MIEKSIDSLARLIRKRLREDKDFVVGITGYEGSGKSNLAILLGIAISKTFDLKRNVIYVPKYKAVARKVTTELRKYEPLILDEAIKVTYKRTWQNRAQIFLNQLFSICRKANLCTILCMPSFKDFDKFWREHRIILWVHILERGHAVVFVKDWSPFTSDPWGLEENRKYVESRSGRKKIVEIPFQTRLNILRGSKHYLMDMLIPKAPEKLFNKYIELNKGYRLEMAQEYEPSTAIKYRESLISVSAYLQTELKLTQKQIANILGVDHSTVSRWLSHKKRLNL